MPPQVTRLAQRADFLRLKHVGSRAVTRSLVLQAACNPSAPADFEHGGAAIRLGFTTSKKLGNAVTRNRIRRRLKAAARAVSHIASPGYDYVIIGRKAALDRPYEELVRDLRYALRRIHAAQEKPGADAYPAILPVHEERESTS